MNSEERNKQSIIRTGFGAIFAGLIIGVFYICYEWSWNNLLSGIFAGIGFTIMFVLTTEVLRLRKDRWRLYLHTVVAGAVGGLVWWFVSTTHTSVVIPLIIGGIAAPLTMWLETRNTA